jgi:hypothetical protein
MEMIKSYWEVRVNQKTPHAEAKNLARGFVPLPSSDYYQSGWLCALPLHQDSRNQLLQALPIFSPALILSRRDW